MKSVTVWVMAVLRRLSGMPPSRRAAHAMAGPVHSICAGSRSSRDTALMFSSPCGLLLLGHQSGIHRLSATATRSVGHILLFFRMAVLRRSSRMPRSRCAAHAMAGSVHSICAWFRPSRGTALLFFLSLWLYKGTTEHGRPHPSLFQVSRQRVAPILFCRARASTGLELAFTPS